MWAVALVVVDRRHRLVDRNLVEVRAAEPAQLRVGVREQPALQQRIVGEVDARHDVPRMERHLLGLGEEVVGVAVQRQPADALHRHQLFGDELGRIEQIEVELVLVLLLDHLDAELPFRKVAVLDRLPQIAAVEVRVLAGDLRAPRPTAPSACRAAASSGTSRSATSPSRSPAGRCGCRSLPSSGGCAGWRGRTSTHMIMCIDSGISEMKSQKVSCADAACGISLCGSGLTAWIRSGNFIASWMKNTGMLLPTRSKIPSSV